MLLRVESTTYIMNSNKSCDIYKLKYRSTLIFIFYFFNGGGVYIYIYIFLNFTEIIIF